jgi:heat shock protein HslJ
MKPIKLITILLISISLFACGSNSTASTQSVAPVQLQHEWVLIDIDGQTIESAIQSTINISAENKVSGNLACNRFFGQLTQQGNKLKIAKMGSTRMRCKTEAMQIESSISNVLKDWSEASILESKLTLISKSHQLTYQLVK